MTDREMFTDEQLNLFIDNQLDTEEKDAIRNSMLEDAALRERVCQLRAVRELVGYAYESVPPSTPANVAGEAGRKRYWWKALAASLLLAVGTLVGWTVNDVARSTQAASAEDVFQYYKQSAQVDRAERKIILHVTTGDIYAVNAALDEAEQLLASYREAGTPMKLDIVTYRQGINMLRVGVSPYVKRIESIVDSNENVSLYACMRSIEKTEQKEGRPVVMMEKAITNKTAQELISERLKKGWIYIKV
jgi:intracellular sulfur oxidation DsrE/DsrF family protein